VTQDSPTCTNAGVEGSYVLEARGDFLAGAPFKPPPPDIEQMYMHSFNETLDHYRALLLA
jgi:hypothetical protein